MINFIWFAFIFIGIIVGMLTGNTQAVTDAAIDYAKISVDLSLGLVGILALWSGLMKIAEEAGLVKALGKAMKPVLVKLFPDVPEDHPAMGSIVMNMAANMLGLGNAATPLGLKAMKQLQELNGKKDTATNAMCMFLAINTSSIQLVATSAVAYRASAGSANPTEIIGATLFATCISTIVAIISVKALEKLPIFKVKTSESKAELAKENN